MNADFLAWLASLTNDDGSGTTGDLLNTLWFDAQMDTIDGVLTDMEDEIEALQAIGFIAGYDSVLYAYTDADTITIASGGQFTTSDSTAFITVAANTALKLSTGRSTDCAAEAANTLYYIWGGQTALGTTAFYFHTSATAMPSELVKGARIRGAARNDNSSNILPFVMTNSAYWYDVNITLTGSDKTEVLETSVGTSWVDVDCSGFLPEGRRAVYVQAAGSAYRRVRPNGSTLADGMQLNYESGMSIAITGADRIFEIRLMATSTMYVSVAGYPL